MPGRVGRMLLALAVLPVGLAAGCADAARRPLPRATVELAGVRIAVEVAATEAARRRGLSGREALAPEAGMWFVFPREEQRVFWMAGMRFPLDIVFLDARRRVVEVVSDAPPPPPPPAAEKAPAEYTSRVPARYVLEVPAGFCRRHDVRPGLEARLTEAAAE